jgi:arylsulfatase A-like enzyme
LRGVPARTVPDRKSNENRSTLGEVLRRRGYRAVQVPTHRFFAERYWANDGFELAVTEEFATVKERRIVRAEPVLKKGLELARSTEGPLFLWIHLMEGHEPYYWRGGYGPRTAESQRRAFRDLDRPAAEFIREFRRNRAGRNVVVAVFGDHGEEFGEHGTVYHSTSVYAEQVRSVFALAAPGLASSRVDAPVTLAALPATVLDLIDEKPVPSFTEPSLLGCIAAREACPDLAVSQMIVFGAWTGYTFERHRLLANPEFGIERLYDSATDPLEQRDLAKSEPELLETLRARAREFDRQHCVVGRAVASSRQYYPGYPR